MKSAGIIGAGITGLTAAHRLQEAGVAVRVYEASRRAGGVVQTVRRDGFLAECGPNTLLETSPVIGGLIHELGIQSRRLYSDPAAEKRFLVRNGKLEPLPASPLAFAMSPLFTSNAKLRLLAEPFVRRAPEDLEESVGEFVVRRLGFEFLNYAINPLVAGVYAGDPWRLSVRHAFPKLHQVEQNYGSLILGQVLGARARRKRGEISKQHARKMSFDDGLSVLTETLHHSVPDTVLGAQVTRLSRSGKGWRIECAPGGPEAEEHDAVLLAAPAHQIARLNIWETGQGLGALGAMNYPPVTSVALGFRREDVRHPLDGFGVLIPEVEGFKLLGTLFNSSLFPGRAPAGHVLLTSYIGGMRAPELALAGESDLVDMARGDLNRLLGATGRPAFVHIARFQRAIPQYEVGFGKFKRIMDEVEQEHPGLFLAGHYRDGISLADSLVSGWNVADRMRAWLGRDTPPSHEDARADSALSFRN